MHFFGLRQKVWSTLIHPTATYTHLISIVGPGAEGEVALLPVEGEVGDVHHTGALCDGWRVPDDLPIVTQLDIGVGWTWLLLICSTQTSEERKHYVCNVCMHYPPKSVEFFQLFIVFCLLSFTFTKFSFYFSVCLYLFVFPLFFPCFVFAHLSLVTDLL